MTRTFLIRLALGATVALGAWGCEDDDGPKPTTDAGDARPADGGADTAGTEAGGTEAGATEAGATEAGGGDAGDAGPALTQQQARGKYLVDVVIACPECHTPRNMMGQFLPGRYLSGDSTPAPNCLFASANRMECVYPRNLTNHETGLKNRTDAEIKKMIMEGKRPAATAGGMEEALHPIMPYYVLKNMTDADADAIVAYLRTVPGVEHMVPRRGASFDIPAPVPAINMANVPMPTAGYADTAAAMRGRYLATQTGLCVECHTKHLPMGPTALDETKFFQGGEDFTGILGPMIPIRSKNLTPDMMTGLGSWTVQQIVTAITEGKDKDGKGICPPMPAGKIGPDMMAGYGNLTAQDAMDIAHYLKSIPPAMNMVQDMCTFPPGM